MSCEKSLSFATADYDYPLDDAVYVPSVDKIFGAMGPYVLKLNASTGAVISAARVSAPAKGPCGICYHALTDMVYVSVWNTHGDMYSSPTRPERDIFPVNPSTMEIGAGLGVYAASADVLGYWAQGPLFMRSNNNYIFYTWGAQAGSGTYIGRVDPAIPADIIGTLTQGDSDLSIDQIAVGGGRVHFPYTSADAMFYFEETSYATDDFCPISGPDQGVVMPISVEWCGADSKPYYVGTNQYMARVDNYAVGTYTRIDISSLADPAPRPQRLRYRSSDGMLYIPSPSTDKITIYDPLGSAVVEVKTGFDSPFDVVFTTAKAFAVQRGPVGLKEIT